MNSKHEDSVKKELTKNVSQIFNFLFSYKKLNS